MQALEKELDDIFKKEVKKFNLESEGLNWEFKYLDKFELGRIVYSRKEIYIKYDQTNKRKFKKIIRHELGHYKYKDKWYNYEILCILIEYCPLEKILV